MSELRTSDTKVIDHYAFVQCHGDSVPGQQSCGLVGLTYTEYCRQLEKPEVGWWCPNCGSSAEYDDTTSERAQGIDANDEEFIDD
jgi:hypothetical protein